VFKLRHRGRTLTPPTRRIFVQASRDTDVRRRLKLDLLGFAFINVPSREGDSLHKPEV